MTASTATDSRLRQKARRDLRADHHRSCLNCGETICLVEARELTTGKKRCLVMNPEPDPSGWLVVNSTGAYVDDQFAIEGERWHRHVCRSRRPRVAGLPEALPAPEHGSSGARLAPWFCRLHRARGRSGSNGRKSSVSWTASNDGDT